MTTDVPVTTGRYALQVNGLSVAFGEHVVLDRVNVAVEPGKVICLLGRSGCGKTTLLRAVADLQRPSSGTIELGDAGARTTRNRGIAMVFQGDSLFPWMSAEENVAFAVRSVGVRPGPALARAREELGRVGLAAFSGARPRSLSGGMRQRVNLARALATDPQVLLMDEPFSALDYLTREEMQDLASHLIAERACTVLFVTHDIPEAVFIGDEIKILTAEARGVAHTLAVPWSRPRDPALKRSAEFQNLVADAQQRIQ